MVLIPPGVVIPDDELTLTFETSRGPGGQNVNKVHTAAVLSFNLESSRALLDDQRALLRRRLASRITREGLLRLRCDTHRTQAANRREVLRRFVSLLEHALHRPTPRRPTRPTAGSRVRRRVAKQQRSMRKSDRKPRHDWES